MNILLTGATGFLGSHLLTRLVDGGHAVTVLVRKTSSFQRIANLLDQVTVHTIGDISFHDLCSSCTIDTIIHCATNYGRGGTAPAELLDANLTTPLQLLQAGYESGVHCFINTDTVLNKCVSNYALSKGQFREWLGTYAQKMVCVNIALEHFYGPHDDTSKFVSFIIRQLLNNVDSIDLTLGEQRRDFIYIDDIVTAFLLVIDNSSSFKSGYLEYEIGTDVTITIRDFVELSKLLARNSHTQLNFGVIPYRENEAMEMAVDTSAIRALGWHPDTSLIDGLSKMIAHEREIRTT